MPRPLVHHYHLYIPVGAEDLAATIWREHVAALEASGLGRRLLRMETSVVGEAFDLPSPPCPHRIVRFAAGHELLTLDRLRAAAHAGDPDTFFLYCHSKGVTHGTGTPEADLNTRWRKAMLAHVVDGWRDSLAPLSAGRCDAAGPFYLEPEAWLARQPYFGRVPYFAGNFWWATSDYLRGLPPITVDDERYLAEIWIGLARPRAFSRTRNIWPSISHCRRSCLTHAVRNRLWPSHSPW